MQDYTQSTQSKDLYASSIATKNNKGVVSVTMNFSVPAHFNSTEYI